MPVPFLLLLLLLTVVGVAPINIHEMRAMMIHFSIIITVDN